MPARDTATLPLRAAGECDGNMSSPTSARTSFWRRPFILIRGHRRAYATITAATYGLLVAGFVAGLLFPALPAARAAALETDGTSDLVTAVASSAPLFALVILAVNVLRLSLLTIVVPSLVVPFAGLAFFGFWVAQTGITLVQSTPVGWVAMIPHTLTVLIELQAYALLAFGAFLLGRAWVRPALVGAPTRRAGYLHGLRSLGILSFPALVLLVVGAVWEAYSLRYLVFPLSELLL